MVISGKQAWERSRQNWELKLLALALGVTTYYAIRGATGDVKDFVVPVDVEVSPGIAVLAKNPDTVEVRFRGSYDDLLKLDQTRLRAKVGVRDETLGGRPQPVPVTRRDVSGARGVSVVAVDPPQVMVTFDHEVEATFGVAKPTTIGKPLLGRAELLYTPQTVSVRGPKTRIAELKAEGHDQVVPDPVDVDGRVESFTRRVQVHSPGGNWASAIDPAEISVQVNIVKKSVSRGWTNLPVLALRETVEAVPVAVDPPVVDLTLEGRSELLENVSDRDIRIFVDCAQLDAAGTNLLPVQVHLPMFMDVNVTVVPKSVRVELGPN